MKIKNKFRYIFVFGIVLLILLSLSINIFALNRPTAFDYNYTVSTYTSNYGVASFYLICDDVDFYLNNNNKYISGNGSSGNQYRIDFINNYGTMYIQVYYNDYDDYELGFYIGATSGNIDIICHSDYSFYLNIGSNRVDFSPSIFTDVKYNQTFKFYNGNNGGKNLYIYNDIPTSTPLTKTYNVGTFYNNNLQYNQIIVNGMSEDTSTFSSITSITYNNNTENYQAVAYNNSAWASGYNSVLQYLWNETAPTISSINSDLNSLITFSTSVVATPLDKSYSLQFQQNGSNFTSIRVVGTTVNGTSYNAISRIDYNSEQVYTNNNFLSGYNNYLGYTYTPPNATNLASLNQDLGGLLVFYTVQVNPTPEEKFFHDIDMSTNGILTIVYAFANNLLSNIVLITMCVALPLVSFAVVQVIRLYKIKKGQ